VFLLHLHDPSIQKLVSIVELVKIFHYDEVCCTDIANYITKSRGEQVVYILDGYDKVHKNLHKSSLVASLMQRKILPDTCIMITASPLALSPFLIKADLHLELVGFTDKDRERFIYESLKQQEHAKEVMDHLEAHPAISWLCYVPFNLAVLLLLYKEGLSLPDHPTQLYEQFICLLVHHFTYQRTNYKCAGIHNLQNYHSNIIKTDFNFFTVLVAQ